MIGAAKHITVLIALFVLSVLCAAGEGNALFERVNVKVSLIEPAEVRYTSSLPLNLGRRQPDNRWVMIAVEYTPKAKVLTHVKRRDRSDTARRHGQMWLDDVNLRVRVIFGSLNAAGRTVNVLMDGDTSFWTVKLDGLKHTAVMFIPAYLIDRYYVQLARSNVNRKSVSAAVASRKIKDSDLIVEAVFSAGGEELARAYSNIGVSNISRAKNKFERMAGLVPGDLLLKGAVLPKGKSPWAFYNINHFDPEKSAAQSK